MYPVLIRGTIVDKGIKKATINLYELMGGF
jgi:hypothetical protein